MSQIIVNGSFPVEGRFSIETYRDTSQKPSVIHRTGMLVTKDAPYIEVIDTLESNKFKIEGVDVFRETAGSEDTERGYEFTFTILKELDKKKSTNCKKERS